MSPKHTPYKASMKGQVEPISWSSSHTHGRRDVSRLPTMPDLSVLGSREGGRCHL